jgi:hypothetical protein
MRAWYSDRFQRSIRNAPARAQKDFEKQLGYLPREYAPSFAPREEVR